MGYTSFSELATHIDTTPQAKVTYPWDVPCENHPEFEMHQPPTPHVLLMVTSKVGLSTRRALRSVEINQAVWLCNPFHSSVIKLGHTKLLIFFRTPITTVCFMMFY